MSQFIKFYFTSSVLNMFRTLIHPSSGACDFSIVSRHWLCVLVSMCVGVSAWLVGVVSVRQASACHTGRDADHSPASSAAVMKEYSYTSTHPVGYTGPVTGSLYLFTFCTVRWANS